MKKHVASAATQKHRINRPALAAFEKQLLAASARLAPKVAAMTDPAAISELMQAELSAACDRAEAELRAGR